MGETSDDESGRVTAWSVFRQAKLARAGVRIDPKREEYDYGRFGWVYDPDGNTIELWEPRGEPL